jgi:hypothetical protein
MGGGSLEDRLFSSEESQQRLRLLGFAVPPPPLSWQERLRIIRDTCRALLYLHSPAESKDVLLHLDVKPANILLDAHGNARLADFGLARTAPELQHGATHVSTSTFAGTPGYLDPSYMERGEYSQLTDGYALGVCLLVCLTSRPALGLLEQCADALEEPGRAPSVADAAAAWPDDVAVDALELVAGLSWQRITRLRTPVADALDRLEELADRVGVRPGLVIDTAINASAAGPLLRECVICMCEPRTVRFGCGHACCCRECADELQGGTQPRLCPACRAPIRVVVDEGAHVACQDTFVQVRRG